jgi:bacterioferritin-associated ferredoxin
VTDAQARAQELARLTGVQAQCAAAGDASRDK